VSSLGTPFFVDRFIKVYTLIIMSDIIQNAVYVPSQRTYYVSANRHDFVAFTVGSEEHFIDGGTDYLRASFLLPYNKIVDYSLTSSNTLKEIREKLLWGTYGKSGNKPLKWVPFRNLSVDHLAAIICHKGAAPNAIRMDAAEYWYGVKKIFFIP